MNSEVMFCAYIIIALGIELEVYITVLELELVRGIILVGYI